MAGRSGDRPLRGNHPSSVSLEWRGDLGIAPYGKIIRLLLSLEWRVDLGIDPYGEIIRLLLSLEWRVDLGIDPYGEIIRLLLSLEWWVDLGIDPYGEIIRLLRRGACPHAPATSQTYSPYISVYFSFRYRM